MNCACLDALPQPLVQALEVSLREVFRSLGDLYFMSEGFACQLFITAGEAAIDSTKSSLTLV
jgi:hypothetical protein